MKTLTAFKVKTNWSNLSSCPAVELWPHVRAIETLQQLRDHINLSHKSSATSTKKLLTVTATVTVAISVAVTEARAI